MSELSVDIKLNQQQAVAGAKDLGSAFEDAATDMEKLAKAGETLGKSTDDIARDLKKAGDSRSFDEIRRDVERADDALDEMGDEADDTRKALGKLSDAGDDIGDGVTKGTDRAREGLDNFKDEANQTARESAASFDGSAESIGDAFQEVAANAFGGFGPVGAAAGIAVAAGIGLGMAGFDDLQKKAQETEERISNMYSNMLESGSAYLSASFIQDEMAEIGADTERYNQALQVSKDLNVDVLDVVRAMAGDTAALTTIIDDQKSKWEEEAEAISSSGLSLEDQAVKLDALNTKYGEQSELFNGILGAQDSAAARFETIHSASSAFLTDLINGASEATVETDALGNSVYQIPGEVPIYVDAQTGVATTNLSAFKGDLDGVAQTVVNPVIRPIVDSSNWDRWRPNPKTGVVMATRPQNANEWQ